MSMQQSWRWYGPNDSVSLSDIRQAGAKGIVNALHEIPVGQVWTVEAIQERKKIIEDAGLVWNVVESVPVAEEIKSAGPRRDKYIEVFQQCISNLGQCGIPTICYNFMPVLDWTRTNLEFLIEDGSTALRFDTTAFAAFDLLILKRPGAEKEYDQETQEKAKSYLSKLSDQEKLTLQQSIIAGLPGSDKNYSLEEFQEQLDLYKAIDEGKLRENLAYFLKKIIPVAEESGVKMAIHPDDPPRPLLGLPRVVSTEADAVSLLEAVDSAANGLTFCTGSYGAHPGNDLAGMVERLGDKIHFLHLRSVQREPDGSFYEANHLEGSANMYQVVKAVVKEIRKRQANGRLDYQIPMRPDHGHKMLDDQHKKTNPGYTAIGRLRGLAELRGLEMGISYTLQQ
ncbi:mannonate dehydratase [Catalinimonas alkaloidigena]|uniref:mannonate dehydratase n=1 Tax=Catalinimonas alkaloidigena TaxID=1075417 RepID=UPI00240651B6|nr:mannonate dehydratase [Catalinimonas alkaloidigena]MDF9795911.1 mannonate dehydratase [Catalinimonas alkaloidigena]